MAATVRELAQLVSGTLVGDGEVVIQAARSLQEAQDGHLTFVENAGYVPALHQSRASAVVAPANLTIPGKILIQVPDPLLAFVVIAQHLQGKTERQATGIDRRAVVHATARVGPDASIGPFVTVGENTNVGQRATIHANVVIGNDCWLGDDVVLHPNVVLYDKCVLGDRVIIHANAVIGADGFGYRFHQGKHVKVPQLGNVVIGNDVEIGAGATIDRGAFQATTIGDGTKIDNLVQIAHNCKIGKHNILAAQVGIAGSCVTGSYVMMGGQVGIRDHINIGDGAMIGAQSGILHDIPPHARMFGYPAQEEHDAGRLLALLKKLPEMRKELLRVLKHLGLAEQKEAA
jgi:UDP-3-O-[3-hydroxymyristoyl] glucosamine N-acyltransferase